MSQPSLSPLDVLRHTVAMNVATEGRTDKTKREAAALADVQALVDAARRVDDEADANFEKHGNPTSFGLSKAFTALRAALARFADSPGADG